MKNQHFVCVCIEGTDFSIQAGPYDTPEERDKEARRQVFNGTNVPFKLDIVNGTAIVSNFSNTLWG